VYDHDPSNLTDAAALETETRLQRQFAQDSEESDLRWLMGSKRGRRIVWRLLERANVFLPVFRANALEMSFAEGNRNFGLHTLTLIHAHCAEHYAAMVKENANVPADRNSQRR